MTDSSLYMDFDPEIFESIEDDGTHSVDILHYKYKKNIRFIPDEDGILHEE